MLKSKRALESTHQRIARHYNFFKKEDSLKTPPPKKIAQKTLFPHEKFFYEKSFPILFREERRHDA